MSDARWYDGLTPDDLPGDLGIVAQECGMDVALKLAEKMGGITVHVCQVDTLLAERKRAWMRENRKVLDVKRLGIATGYSERQVRRVLSETKEEDKQEALPI